MGTHGMRDFLAEVARFNGQTAGRDRLFRLFQYSSRFVWYWLQKTSCRRDTVARLQNLEVLFSSGRRLLRLGRFLDSLHGATRMVGLPDLTYRLSLTLARLGNALYILSDNLVWLHQAGLLNLRRESWSRTSNKFWLVAIVASLSRDITELCRIIPPLLLSPPHTRPWKNSGLTLLRVAGLHRALLLDLVKNLADFWIPYSNLGHATLEPGTVGLLGVVSSVAAILPMLDPSYVLTPA
ncbi:peroxisomal membrane protein 11B [Ixodes scapularis]